MSAPVPDEINPDEISAFNRDMVEKLDSIPRPAASSWSIYKTQHKLRKKYEFAYTPEMVSIGPFHHGSKALQAMEDHKLRYMNALLTRSGNREAKLQQCFQAIYRREVEARRYYSESVEPDRNKFIEMMLVDGLFTIELFLRSARVVHMDEDDPIVIKWGTSSLIRDMMLLENQLPMFVLETLFDITKDENQHGRSLNALAIHFFNPLMPRHERVLLNCCSSSASLHLLDLLRNSFKVIRLPTSKLFYVQVQLAPSVTELQEAGVKFGKASGARSFLDISFANGVLNIPPIQINDQTQSLLLNFIASEHRGSDTCIISYAILMANLITTQNDVEVLCKNGIIRTYKSNYDCACLLKKLGNDVLFCKFYYSDLCKELTKYHNRWHVWRTELKLLHFKSPWRALSVFGAVLLLILTVTQTLFAILSYVFPHS